MEVLAVVDLSAAQDLEEQLHSKKQQLRET
jgi:hypothetical protein